MKRPSMIDKLSKTYGGQWLYISTKRIWKSNTGKYAVLKNDQVIILHSRMFIGG